MRIPTRQQAEHYLAEAQELNPGPWVQHSVFVAEAARAIATPHPDLDAGNAYILGCLHDIGRREGVTDMRHILDGYTFLRDQGYEDAARICLTHSFPVKHIRSVAGVWDCSDEEFHFVQDYIAAVEFTAYDRLIQLCDALALPSGCCLMEKRLVDVVVRYGFNDHTITRWKVYFNIQRQFEKAIGRSIYSVLPGVVENTFGLSPDAR